MFRFISTKKIFRLISSSLLALFFVLLASAPLLSVNTIAPVAGKENLEEQLKELEDKLAEIQKAKDEINKVINENKAVIGTYSDKAARLFEEILIFQNDIQKLELQIQEIEINIKLVTREIEAKEREIETKEKNIDLLETESSKRIKQNYIKFRLYGNNETGSSNILNTENVNEFFKEQQYKEIIQRDTNSLMKELAKLKEKLIETRKELDRQLAELKKQKDSIDIKRMDLDKKKAEIQAQRDIYFQEITSIENQINNESLKIAAFSEEEAKSYAEAERIRNQLFNSFTPVKDGTKVVAGQIIGRQGQTGLATGPHLHFMVWENGAEKNPCAYLNGCKGDGIVKLPVSSTPAWTSWYGERCFSWNGKDYCDIHNGVDMQIKPWNGPILAAHDGYAYKGTDDYGALYVIVCEQQNCESGIKTGYWHLSEY